MKGRGRRICDVEIVHVLSGSRRTVVFGGRDGKGNVLVHWDGAGYLEFDPITAEGAAKDVRGWRIADEHLATCGISERSPGKTELAIEKIDRHLKGVEPLDKPRKGPVADPRQIDMFGSPK